jgi:hypothetical protein
MDYSFWIDFFLFALLMALSAFFSSSETALFSLSSIQREQMRRQRHPRIDVIERLLARPRRLIISILIGNDLVNVAASVISASFIIRLLGMENKWFNLLVMVPVLLLFGDITPKTLAIRNNVAFAAAECRRLSFSPGWSNRCAGWSGECRTFLSPWSSAKSVPTAISLPKIWCAFWRMKPSGKGRWTAPRPSSSITFLISVIKPWKM